MKSNLLMFFFCIGSSLFCYSQVPQLWGTMSTGGVYGIGGIIKINGDGTGYSKVYSCMGMQAGGSMQSNLINGGGSLLFGCSVSGGTHSLGDIFSYNTTTNTYSSLFSMDSASGFYPRGGIIKATNNKLYGMTSNGGSKNIGVLFSFDLAGNQYVKLHDFDTITGQYPNGGLVQSSVNGKIYGMTTSGGTSSAGVIFSYDIATSSFSIVHNFNFANGFAGFGTLMESTNGLLYGMAFGGGTTGYGVIFSLDPLSNNYTVMHTFNGTDGSAPYNSVLHESGGILYGCTSQGGTNNKGVIFSLGITGNTFTKLHDFDAATGSSPYGGVIKATDGKLYGMTLNGGLNNLGAIYSYNLITNTYTKIYDGSFADGGFPYADLMEYAAPTGIAENKLWDDLISIFPNPSDGQFEIAINGLIGDVQLSIYNNMGKQLLEQNFHLPASTATFNYPSGIYYVKASQGAHHYQTKKVIIY